MKQPAWVQFQHPRCRVDRKPYPANHPLFKKHHAWAHYPRTKTQIHAVRPYPFPNKLYCGGDVVGLVPFDPSELPGEEFYICLECMKPLESLFLAPRTGRRSRRH